jgi:hypothetical protein
MTDRSSRFHLSVAKLLDGRLQLLVHLANRVDTTRPLHDAHLLDAQRGPACATFGPPGQLNVGCSADRVLRMRQVETP